MVGDLIMTLPALELLHKEGLLGRLIGPGYSPSLLAGLPYEIETVADNWHQEVARYRQYKKAGYGYGLIFRSSFSPALQMRQGGIRPIAYRRNLRTFLLWRSIALDFSWHRVYEFYRLAQFTVAMLKFGRAPDQYEQPPFLDLPLTPAQKQKAQTALAAADVCAPYTVICPLAGNRKFPTQKIYADFPLVTERLLGEGEPVITCPGPGEEEECRSLAPGSIELDVDMAGYAGILAGAHRVIGADTGPVHVAAALGVPCLSIFGDSIAEKYTPWGSRGTHVGAMGRWPAVDEVWEKIQEMDHFRRPLPRSSDHASATA